MTSFWSLNRDAEMDNNSGIYAQYEHTKINMAFGSQEPGEGGGTTNAKPSISGVDNKTITVGDSFDKMAGVTAKDREDGDLTNKITVSGNVDTSKVGSYTLTYSVKDSTGATTTAKRTITVKAKPEKTADVNGDGKVDAKDLSLVSSKYNLTSKDSGFNTKYDVVEDGIIDIYDIVKVASKMGDTTGGEDGGDDGDDGNTSGDAWKDGAAYSVGDIVTYEGKKYKCINAHTANAGWTPSLAFTLWQEVK